MKYSHIDLCQITKMFIMNFYVLLAAPTVHIYISDIYISCFIFQLITGVIEDVNNTASKILAGQYN